MKGPGCRYTDITCSTALVEALGVGGRAVVGGDELPSPIGFHPHVGQPVVIVVRLAAEHAFFVICARHHGDVLVKADLEIRDFGDIHAQRACVVADESNLAVGAAIFEGDYVVVGQQRRDSGNLPLLIRVQAFCSRARMAGASDFSWAKVRTARYPKRPRAGTENTRARIFSYRSLVLQAIAAAIIRRLRSAERPFRRQAAGFST